MFTWMPNRTSTKILSAIALFLFGLATFPFIESFYSIFRIAIFSIVPQLYWSAYRDYVYWEEEDSDVEIAPVLELNDKHFNTLRNIVTAGTLINTIPLGIALEKFSGTISDSSFLAMFNLFWIVGASVNLIYVWFPRKHSKHEKSDNDSIDDEKTE